jgi:hypothetical protein
MRRHRHGGINFVSGLEPKVGGLRSSLQLSVSSSILNSRPVPGHRFVPEVAYLHSTDQRMELSDEEVQVWSATPRCWHYDFATN